MLDAKYIQNDKKIPAAKSLSAFSEDKNIRWLNRQAEGAHNSIKSADLQEKE